MEKQNDTIAKFIGQIKNLVNKARRDERLIMLSKLSKTEGIYTLPKDAEVLMYELVKDEKTITEGGEEV